MRFLILMSLLIVSAHCVSAPEQIMDAAKYSHPPRPQYPTLSIRHEEEGRVLVQAKIRIDGTPTDIQVYKSSGYPLLDTSAVESVKELIFIPAKTNAGKSVESHVVIPIRFELK